MSPIPHTVYHFLFSRRRASTSSDPEQGSSSDQSHELDEITTDSKGSATRDPANPSLRRDSFTTGDDGTNNLLDSVEQGEDNDDDDIIDELEHEEYPETHPPPHRRVIRPSKAQKPSWWVRLKTGLDPHTSPADLEAYVPHYRYLPIFSGVIIPFSILLEIPGLTSDWYIRTENHITVKTRRNTTILDLGLAFSITFAALANAKIILDVINITAVTVFGVEHRFDDGYTYGQAFWMTVCSTSVSTLTNITLIIDLVRTPDFDTSVNVDASVGSGLTRKQRTLVISVMALLAYIGFGALVQTFMLDLTFINALYFTVVTIETVGFGDIVPKNARSRIFTCFYAIFGIISLALTVGLTRESVLEGLEVSYRRRVKAARQRRRAARFERSVVKRWNAAIEWRLRRAGLPVWVPDENTRRGDHVWHRCRDWVQGHCWPHKKSRFRKYLDDRMQGHYRRGMHLNLEKLSWTQLEAAAMEAGVPLQTLLPDGFQPLGQSLRATERAFAGSDTRPDVSEGATRSEKSNREQSSHKGKEREQNVEWKFRAPYIPDGEQPLPLTHARLGRMISMLGNFALAFDECSVLPVPEHGPDIGPTITPKTRLRDLPRVLSIGGDTLAGISALSTVPTRTVADQYEDLRSSMADEERRAFWVRFWFVWLIFWVFWLVGSAIFMTTEKWSFGNALYFCFIAFTTIGYGDFTPTTPAGRSVFVFWALLGIPTMTILISIVSDAYSSRYKSIFSSGLVTQAVRRYQQRARDNARLRARQPSVTLTMVPTIGPDTATTYVQPYSPLTATTMAAPVPPFSAFSDSQKRVMGQLEALPEQVLRHARTFGEEVQYLIEPEVSIAQGREGAPDSLKALMDDVAGVEKLGEEIKEEILRDADARHALLAISIENVLQKIVAIAKEAIEAVKERDRLRELQGIDVSSQTVPEMEEKDDNRLRQRLPHSDDDR
ncbi:hypothetical protein H0H92_009498 [Tricholoma furcatifolium]|nr:hypothetical protein H0H92_009498 [Tricholoma furcatifolium]